MPKITEIVEKVTTTEEVTGFVIQLSIEEMLTLHLVTTLIGGVPDNSLRGYSDSVGKKIVDELGYYPTYPMDYPLPVVSNNTQTFFFEYGSKTNKTFTDQVKKVRESV